MGSVEAAYLGVASATLSAMRTIGQTLSMGVATLILALYVGSAAITPASHESFAAGFRLAFLIFPASACSASSPRSRGGTMHGTKPRGGEGSAAQPTVQGERR